MTRPSTAPQSTARLPTSSARKRSMRLRRRENLQRESKSRFPRPAAGWLGRFLRRASLRRAPLNGASQGGLGGLGQDFPRRGFYPPAPHRRPSTLSSRPCADMARHAGNVGRVHVVLRPSAPILMAKPMGMKLIVLARNFVQLDSKKHDIAQEHDWRRQRCRSKKGLIDFQGVSTSCQNRCPPKAKVTSSNLVGRATISMT
jgi:hypothetical protein